MNVYRKGPTVNAILTYSDTLNNWRYIHTSMKSTRSYLYIENENIKSRAEYFTITLNKLVTYIRIHTHYRSHKAAHVISITALRLLCTHSFLIYFITRFIYTQKTRLLVGFSNNTEPYILKCILLTTFYRYKYTFMPFVYSRKKHYRRQSYEAVGYKCAPLNNNVGQAFIKRQLF